MGNPAEEEKKNDNKMMYYSVNNFKQLIEEQGEDDAIQALTQRKFINIDIDKIKKIHEKRYQKEEEKNEEVFDKKISEEI